MNAQRRKQLARAVDLLMEARLIVEQCQEEEEECFYNLSDNLQMTERGQKLEENADTLSEIASDISDQEDNINDVIA